MSTHAVPLAFQEGLGDAGHVQSCTMQYVRQPDGKQKERWSVIILLTEGARDLFTFDKPHGANSVSHARFIGEAARQSYSNPELQEPAGL